LSKITPNPSSLAVALVALPRGNLLFCALPHPYPLSTNFKEFYKAIIKQKNKFDEFIA
jgi:hypothetical protein